MVEIKLTRGAFAIVDNEDAELLSQKKWSLSHYGYAERTDYNGSKIKVYMHRLIIGAKKGEQVDHINGNKLDNRRTNLRLCSESDNRYNKPKYSNKVKAKYKGVFALKNKITKPWVALIHAKGKRHYLGTFATQELAAIAYNKKAKELHGDFANLNQIGE